MKRIIQRSYSSIIAYNSKIKAFKVIKNENLEEFLKG